MKPIQQGSSAAERPRGARARVLGSVLPFVTICLVACDNNRSSSEPAPPPAAPAPGSPESPPLGRGGAPSGDLDQNVGTAGAAGPPARPSVEDNMARHFQGSFRLRVKGPDGAREVAYFARGNTARIQLEGVGKPLDALVWERKMSVIDHDRKTYVTSPLDDLKTAEEADVEVDEAPTGERVVLRGVVCERTNVTQGAQRIEACVGGLPGEIDIDEVETVSGIDVPAWVEELIDEDKLPLQAEVREGDRTLYTVELLEYSPEPVPDTVLRLPEGYRARDASEPAAP